MFQVGVTDPFSHAMKPSKKAGKPAAPIPPTVGGDTVKFGSQWNENDGKPLPPPDPEKRRKLIRIAGLGLGAMLTYSFISQNAAQEQQKQAQNPIVIPVEFAPGTEAAPIPYQNNDILSGAEEATRLVRAGYVARANRVDVPGRTNLPAYELTLRNNVTVHLINNMNDAQHTDLVKAMREKRIQPKQVVYESSFLASAAGMLIPVILMMVLFRFMMGSAMGGRGGMMGGLTKLDTNNKPTTPVTFDDVRGYPEVVKELKKIANRYIINNLGREGEGIKTKPIKGFLLEGPPGTGKTMMARAMANEAKVPFHYASGSAFVQMFVGLGATRVRELFAQAKKDADQHGGAIIFIDEIDSIGQKRGATGIGGGHDEREQTLNELLQQMSGFADDPRILIMAATNRAEQLDDALLRSGRFDKRVKVDLPYDKEQRLDILDAYLDKKNIAKDLDIDAMGELTMGMSGADIANLVNQMAEVANERIGEASKTEAGRKLLENPEFKKMMTRDFNDALRNIAMGMKREQRGTPEELLTVAVHEGVGHGFVARAARLRLYLISNQPRGKALGHVMPDPRNSSKILQTFQSKMKDLVMTMGGRASEAELLGAENITPGAAGDIEQAKQTIRGMMATGMLPNTGAGDYLNPNFPLKEADQKLMQEVLDDAENTARKVIRQADPQMLMALVKKMMDLKEEIQGPDADRFYDEVLAAVGTEKLYAPIQEFIDKYAKMNLPKEAPDSGSTTA